MDLGDRPDVDLGDGWAWISAMAATGSQQGSG
jgi:hypothetical protein